MTLTPDQLAALDALVRDLASYSSLAVGKPLRPYQLDPGRAVVRSVLAAQGLSFTVLMARQAGKNELSAQLQAYLLTRCRLDGGTVVKAAPTFRPQVVTSMLRLKDVLDNPLAEVLTLEAEQGFVLKLGNARVFFLSAEPTASVVGATASLLLEVDEAQDVDADKHDRDLAPMAAATNATRVYYGTAGRPDDLLQRMKHRHLELQRKDGVQRHFEYPWSVVAEHNPAYAAYVLSERDRLGASHPVFRSQYCLEPVAPVDALLDPMQRRLLRGDHPRQAEPDPTKTYVAGVDIAGPAEVVSDPYAAPKREGDSTVVTIAEVGDSGGDVDPWGARRGPVARIVHLIEWRGRTHQAQYRDLLRVLDETWRCRRIAFDASGLGGPVASFLRDHFGDRLVPFVFTQQSKTELGYDLIAAVNGDRVKMYAAEPDDANARAFWAQLDDTRREVHAAGTMSWSARRGHDDFVTSLALCVHAAGTTPADHFLAIVQAADPYTAEARY